MEVEISSSNAARRKVALFFITVNDYLRIEKMLFFINKYKWF